MDRSANSLDHRAPLPDPEVVRAVSRGLLVPHKSLPAWLLYDARGSALYEQITRLPEYYLTRAETEIFADYSDAIVAQLRAHDRDITVAELGAGTAEKTLLLLAAIVRAQTECTYLACDIAPAPLRIAKQRITQHLPSVRVHALIGTHREVAPLFTQVSERQVLLFIGSSLGNYTDPDAIALLSGMRRYLRGDAMLVLGTDLRKDPRVLLAAYDDPQGLSAAFNVNLLQRLNRELYATFDLDAFRHVATWDAVTSNVEIYLEAVRSQRVWIAALQCAVHLAAGERIHTETSAKYDQARIERILRASGFTHVAAYFDRSHSYAVHVATVATGTTHSTQVA